MIVDAVAATPPSHLSTLLGERPDGSMWGRPFTEADFSLPWEEVTPDDDDGRLTMPGCRYFRLGGAALRSAFPNAVVGAVRIASVPDSLLPSVMICEGAHGRELRLRPDAFELLDVGAPTEAWLVLGPSDGVEVVFTVFPGPLLSSLKMVGREVRCVADVLEADALSTAVKLERSR